MRMQYSVGLTKRITLAAIISVIGLLTTLTSMGVVIFVDDAYQGTGQGSQAHPYQTITAAVDASSPGDTIQVAAGTYTEHVFLGNLRDLTFIGEGAGTFLAGSGYSIDVRNCDNMTFQGFHVRGGEWGMRTREATNIVFIDNIIEDIVQLNDHSYPPEFESWGWGGAFNCRNSSIRLEGNTIVNNYGGVKGGIGYFLSCELEVVDNYFAGNTARDTGGGFFVESYLPTLATFEENYFEGSKSARSGAIHLDGNVSSKIAHNTFVGSGSTHYKGGAIRLDLENLYGGNGVPDPDVDIINNTVTDIPHPCCGPLRMGVYVTGMAMPVHIANNIFEGPSGFAVYAEASAANVLVEYNDQTGLAYGGIQVGAGNISADPLFVDAAGGDYQLQSGSPCIDAGHPGSEYLDADGTRNDMGAFGGSGNVLWMLGTDNGSDAEFDQSSFNPDFVLGVDFVGEFPKELNTSWYQHEYVHFDISQEIADAGLTVKLDPAWNDGWGFLVVVIEVWEGGWKYAGEAAVNMYNPGTIEIPASLLQSGPNTFRLVAAYGWDWTSVLTWDQIVISKTPPKEEFILGENNGSDWEFDQSGFSLDFELGIDPVSEFPKELNIWWHTQQYVHFDISQAMADAGLTVQLDAAWNDGWDALFVGIEVWDGIGWAYAGETPVNMYSPGSIDIPPSLLQSGPGAFRLVALYGTGWTTVLTWDQIIISKTVVKTEVILGIDNGSDSEFDASGFNPIFDADTMTVSEFPKELNTGWYSTQEIELSIEDDALANGLTLTLDAMWNDGSGLLDVLVEVDSGSGYAAVGTAQVNVSTKGTVTIPAANLSSWVVIRLTAVSGSGGTTVAVWDQVTLRVP